MAPDTLIFLALGALAGGFMNGLAGTGTALFALGFYLVVLNPLTAVAIVALMSVLAGLQGIWVVRSEIRNNPTRVARYVVPGIVGVPLGILLLNVIEANTLRIFVALVLIIHGGYFTIRASLPKFDPKRPVIDMAVGFIGGILGGTASLSGALPLLWLSVRPWRKSEIRAVLQCFNVVILSTTVTLLIFEGAYDAEAIRALLITLPIGLLGAQLGIFVFGRVTDQLFQRLLILLTLLMGIGVLGSTLIQ